MGNQNSNEHERNKSADDVLERRRRNDDNGSKPSNNNTSFILENRLKSPKTENKRRISSPGLDILATDIKRGMLAKRVSTRDYRNINSTLRFVEAFATIKHQSGNSINLNEAPNLGFNLEAIRENFPPNEALFDNRMSFSTDFNDPSQKFKFKMENYYASRDKIAKTHSEKYVKTRKQKPRPISLQNDFMVKPKNFSFDLSPSNSTPQSHNASFATPTNAAAAEIRTPRPFRDLVDEVLGKNKKAASATKGTHGEILGELKNIKGALSRIKKREQATSLQVPKTSEITSSKSPIRSVNSSCKKAHCHSKSEVTPKKVSAAPLPNELFRIDEEKTSNSVPEKKPVIKVNKVESKSKTPKQFSPEKTKRVLAEKAENLVVDIQPKKEKHPLFGDLSVKKKPSVSGTSSLNNTEPRKTARSRIEEIKNKEEIQYPKAETAKKPRPSQIYNKENKPINATPSSQRYSKASSENDGTSYTALSNKKKTQPSTIKQTHTAAPTKRFDLVTYKQQHELKSHQTSEDATNTSSQLHRDIALKKAYQPLYLNDMSEHLSQPLDTIEVCPVAEPYEENPPPIEAVLDLSQYIAATPQNKENIGIFKVSQKIDEIYKVQRLNDRLKEADMNNIPKSESRYRADHSDEEQDFTEEDIEENVFVDEIKEKLSKISVGQYHGTTQPTIQQQDTVNNSTDSQPQQIKKYESSFPEYMKNLFHDADSNMNDSFRKNLQKIGSALEKTKKLIAQKFNQQDSHEKESISHDKDHTLKSYEESGEENFTEDPNLRESKDERMSFIKVFPSHIAETHFASFNE